MMNTSVIFGNNQILSGSHWGLQVAHISHEWKRGVVNISEIALTICLQLLSSKPHLKKEAKPNDGFSLFSRAWRRFGQPLAYWYCTFWPGPLQPRPLQSKRLTPKHRSIATQGVQPTLHHCCRLRHSQPSKRSQMQLCWRKVNRMTEGFFLTTRAQGNSADYCDCWCGWKRSGTPTKEEPILMHINKGWAILMFSWSK